MKVIKTNVKISDKYSPESYPESGIYENTDENNYVEIMFLNKPQQWCFMLGTPHDLQFFYEESRSEESLNEKTMLKAIAIASGYVEYKDI